MKFKIGDKVRIVKNIDDDYFDKYIGQVKTVEEIIGNGYLLNTPDAVSDLITWDEDELELYEVPIKEFQVNEVQF